MLYAKHNITSKIFKKKNLSILHHLKMRIFCETFMGLFCTGLFNTTANYENHERVGNGWGLANHWVHKPIQHWRQNFEIFTVHMLSSTVNNYLKN